MDVVSDTSKSYKITGMKIPNKGKRTEPISCIKNTKFGIKIERIIQMPTIKTLIKYLSKYPLIKDSLFSRLFSHLFYNIVSNTGYRLIGFEINIIAQ